MTRGPGRSPAARAGTRCWLLLGLACAEPALPGPRSPPAPALASAFEAGWGRVAVKGQGLELWLPDLDGWRHDPRERRSWVVSHAATQSRLLVRVWRADHISPVAECERQMRAWRRDLPLPGDEARLETRALRLAGDRAAELWSAVTTPSSSGLGGYAQLVASDGRECTFLAYTTSTAGADGARVLAERLGVMTRQVFERLRRVDVSERVQVPRR